MNARMNELADQCTSYNDSDGWIFDKAKFASLIVREAIMALDQDDGATHHEELLKQHFGVDQ